MPIQILEETSSVLPDYRKVSPAFAVSQRFIAELRPIPLEMFEEKTPLFQSWPDAPCGYIRLSPSYMAETDIARSRGWSVREVDSTHLGMLIDPITVRRIVLDIQESIAKNRGAITT